MAKVSDAIDQLKATGDVPAFVSTLGGDLKADFNALPNAPALKTWAVAAITTKLTSAGLSPTMVELVGEAVSEGL